MFPSLTMSLSMAECMTTTRPADVKADHRLGVEALAAAHRRFTELAAAAPDAETREAWCLAARVTDSLSNLRDGISAVILKAELGPRPFAMADAVRGLRAAMDAAASREA
jgi:hypothetical protein